MRDLPYLVSQAFTRPLSFLLRKARDEVLSSARGSLSRLGLNPYRHRLNFAVISSWSLFLPNEVDQAIELAVTNHPSAMDRVKEEAEMVLAGRVEILSHSVSLAEPINWHSDPVSGRTWPRLFHTRYSYPDLLELEYPSDVKMPWELSRMQFLPTLVLAGRMQSDGRPVRRAREIFENWTSENPVGWGVNWTVGMEAAIRLINLVWTSELLRGSALREFFPEALIRQSVAEHGRFLFRNVEHSDVSGNHYSSCVLGLLYAGCFVPEERESTRWRRFARRELHREILRETYPDGACHEGSIPYHRLVLEIFTHAYRLLARSDEGVDAVFLKRLERMFEFTAAYAKPNGQAPVWGDADDGRIVRLYRRSINDHRYLASIGAAIFHRADLKSAGTALDLEALLLLAPEEISAYDALPGLDSPTKSTAFPDSGYYILRRGGDYCLVDCGDVGLRGRGGHGHNDALAIELTLADEDLLVDTGCAAYTRSVEDRINVLGARAHNTVIIDGTEPAPISSSRFPHASACAVQAVEWNPGRPSFVGRRLGDARIPGISYLQRDVSMETPGRLFLQDTVEGTGKHRLEWFFHLDEGWEVDDCVDDAVELRRGLARSSIRCLGRPDRISYEGTVWFPSYGKRRNRISIGFEIAGELPIQTSFIVAVRTRSDSKQAVSSP